MANTIRRLIGTTLLAAMPLAGCDKPIETNREVYMGNLPGFGATELVVFYRKGTQEIVCAEIRSDLYNNFGLVRACDYRPDGRLEFDEIQIEPAGYGSMRHVYRGFKDFKPADESLRSTLAARGNYLKKTGTSKSPG